MSVPEAMVEKVAEEIPAPPISAVTTRKECEEDLMAPVRLAPGVLVGNLREPTRLTGVNLCGVSAEPARSPGQVKVWTSLALTSDERLFHRVVESLGSAITHLAQQAGAAVNLGRADGLSALLSTRKLAERGGNTA